jgi:hypothetical protein
MRHSNEQSVVIPEVHDKPVHVVFDEALTTSDGGAFLLKMVDEKIGVTGTLAAFIRDAREVGKVSHSVQDLIRQRVFGLALGYPDTNDAERLAEDPMQKLMVDRDPVRGQRLSSQSTLSRFENSLGRSDLLRLGLSLADSLFAWQSRIRRRRRVKLVTIDLDPSDDPAHGQQEGVEFNGHYDCHCYLPLLGFVSFDEDPEQYAIGALLRSGRASAQEGAWWMLSHLFARIRRYFPNARIRVRLDGGFAGPDLLSFLEAEQVEYLVGIASNSRLKAESCDLEEEAWEAFSRSGETVSLFDETRYAARSWGEDERRVVIKAEIVQCQGRLPRENVRYVVTNLKRKAENVYQLYRQRGDSENRIKELFLSMELGRTSCHRFEANQFRVLLTLAAFMLMQELRRRVARRNGSRPQVDKLRLMLLKIGGRIESSVRRVVVHLSKAHPWTSEWRHIARELGALTP